MGIEYSVPIIALERCGADIVTVRLQRPDGYTFLAGQWFRVTVETPGGAETRTFSHAAAPDDSWIELTTRLSSSAFKQALGSMAPGSEVRIGPAAGRFALPQDAGSLTLLVGGVGVTPVRSTLRAAVRQGRVFSDALVILGNRDATCEPYADELASMGPSGVRLVRVLERAGEEWTGETGFVTADLVRRHGGVEGARTFVVTGPPVMVEAMMRVLDELGVSRDSAISEPFGKLDSGANRTLGP
jgi:ferredoxin-NADP reductase